MVLLCCHSTNQPSPGQFMPIKHRTCATYADFGGHRQTIRSGRIECKRPLCGARWAAPSFAILAHMKQATILYCIQGSEVLLGMKKKDFGAGKWNGFGGKVKEGETVEEAAVRELAEESGLRTTPAALQRVADVQFYFADAPIFHCHAFRTTSWEGEPVESDEMRPEWFKLDALPYEAMWESDLHWLPQALAGTLVRALCRFDEKGEHVVSFELLQ